jgi:uncharacterized protein YebE (UPF0316 family)
MRKNESCKNYRNRRQLFLRQRRESGQTFTEFVLVLAALALVTSYLIGRLAPPVISYAVGKNLGPVVEHAVEDKYSQE